MCAYMMLSFFLCKVLSIREALLIIVKSFSFAIILSGMEFSWIEFIDFTTFLGRMSLIGVQLSGCVYLFSFSFRNDFNLNKFFFFFFGCQVFSVEHKSHCWVLHANKFLIELVIRCNQNIGIVYLVSLYDVGIMSVSKIVYLGVL